MTRRSKRVGHLWGKTVKCAKLNSAMFRDIKGAKRHRERHLENLPLVS
jgi:hypothetical protein